MKFVCLGYIEPGKLDQMPKPERELMLDECFEYDDQLRANGHFALGEALEAPNSAKAVHPKNGKILVTDGAYAETKEQLGGILALEARDFESRSSTHLTASGSEIRTVGNTSGGGFERDGSREDAPPRKGWSEMSRLRRTSSAGLLCWFVIAWIASAQPQRPNVKAQAEAMKKLAFLVGTWNGDATTVRSNQKIKVRQTEEVSYKLDGLVLLIEGTGRNPESGEVRFRSLATVSYDDGAGVYHFRAYNDGSYLDTQLKVPDRSFEWGYKSGPAQITFAMKLNDAGDWVETGDVSVGNTPAQRFFDMTVRKQK